MDNTDPQPKISLGTNYVLHFHPKSTPLEKRYGITIRYYKDGKPDPDKRLDYIIRLKIKKHPQHPVWKFTINKEQVFFNQKEPDLVAEELSIEMIDALFPIEIDVAYRMQPLEDTLNHCEITKRWTDKKAKIYTKRAGKLMDEVITQIDHRIKNRHTIERSLKQDLFWQLFFHPIHLEYTPRLKRESDLLFSFDDFTNPIRLQGVQLLKEELTPYGTVQVNFSSDEEAPGSLGKYKQKEETVLRLKSSVIYDLDKDSYLPKCIRANCDLYQPLHPAHSVRKVAFSLYVLAEENKNSQFIPDKPSGLDWGFDELNKPSKKPKPSYWELFKKVWNS